MYDFVMLDLCAGNKTASAAMRDHGWQIITVDLDAGMQPDIVADIRGWSWAGRRPDLLWCSPPCDEFAREFMPWSKTGAIPDMSIYYATLRIIGEVQPRFWVIENVQGAIPYFGKPTAKHRPFFFWGFFPPLGSVKFDYRKKESYGSSRKIERAAIPYGISLAFALAVERYLSIYDFPGVVDG